MLSYSQVDRILRPLRNRCTALAASPALPADVCQAPPLSVLPSPDAIGLRIHFNKYLVSTLELSRKLYAVRDCFRDFLVKILGPSGSQCAQERVIPLADLCAIIVGARLRGELEQTQNIEADPTVELFEAVPLQYRRRTIIAISLDLVLQLCPLSPTLLRLLLDVTLTFRLATESSTILQALFTLACDRSALSGPPICHQAHQTFLVELCDQWTSHGLTTDAFVRILLTVAQTADFSPIWSCKSMEDFMLKLDVTSYLSCLYSLSRTSFDLSPKGPSPARQELYGAVQRWLNVALRFVHENVDVMDCILHYIDASLERANVTTLNIKDAVICLATHWLSEYSLKSTPYQLARIELMLRRSHPRPTTYRDLMLQVIESENLQRVKDTIQSHAFTLRFHDLPHHEASLWACISRLIESSGVEQTLSARSGTEAFKKFRIGLIDQVEDAEKRCFGRRCQPSSRDMPHGTRRRRTSEGSGEWSWDPSFRCWHRPCDSGEPVLKKPRVTSCHGDGRKPPTSEAHENPRAHRSLSACLERSKIERVPESAPTIHFATILSRAATNRTVLHLETHRSGDEGGCPPPGMAVTSADPESDDALNLFQYVQYE